MIILFLILFINKCIILLAASNLPRVLTGRNSPISTSRNYVKASDGIDIEILSRMPLNFDRNKPPLLFIHGSGAGGWIWDEYWLKYFADEGFATFAVSLRGSAATGRSLDNNNKDAVKMEEHIDDLKKVLFKINNNKLSSSSSFKSRKKVCIAGHSFGGLVLTKLFEDSDARDMVSSAIWMCAVPPSGQGRMAARFFRTRFWDTLEIIRGFAFGKARTDPKLNRKIFYDPSIDLKSVKTYMDRLALDEEIMEDIAGVEMQQPSRGRYGDQAAWINDAKFKRFVVGAQEDKIVDPPAIEETAQFVGSELGAIMIPNNGHNIMLSPRWKEGAQVLLDLLKDRC